MTKRKSKQQPFVRFLFLIYSGLMLWLLFGRSQGWTEGLSYWQMLRQNVNLIPLLTIKNYLHVVIHGTFSSIYLHCFINLAGNVIMFVPIGYLLPRIWKKQQKFPLFLATCIGLIFLVEILQLFTLLGSFDVDDIILNLFGIIVGYMICILKK